jgi:hypothetical protein
VKVTSDVGKRTNRTIGVRVLSVIGGSALAEMPAVIANGLVSIYSGAAPALTARAANFLYGWACTNPL